MKQYKDNYFKKAKQENYPARSVYKLQEIHKRYHIFQKGQKVLDLGAAPGSWSQYAAERVGKKGRVLAVDKKEIDIGLPEHVCFIQSDLFEPSEEFASWLDYYQEFDLVISDLAPGTSGIKLRDQTRSLELAEKVRALGESYLKKGGTMVLKVFTGPDLQDFLSSLKYGFKRVKTFKPQSSRSESMECYVLGFGKKNKQ